MVNFKNPWADNPWDKSSAEGNKWNPQYAEVVEVESGEMEENTSADRTKGIIGLTRADIRSFKRDLVYLLELMDFDALAETIDTQRKKLIFSDLKIIEHLINDNSLSINKKTFLQLLYNTIQSIQFTFKIEYTDSNVRYDENGKIVQEFISIEGSSAWDKIWLKTESKETLETLKPPGYDVYSATVIDDIKKGLGGITIPTPSGVHIIISGKLSRKLKSLTAIHELLGHGVASTTNMSDEEKQENGIRLNNLILRILGESEEYRVDHNIFTDKSEYDPYPLPIIK